MFDSIRRICGPERTEVAWTLDAQVHLHVNCVRYSQFELLLANAARELLVRVKVLVVRFQSLFYDLLSTQLAGDAYRIRVISSLVSLHVHVVPLAHVAFHLNLFLVRIHMHLQSRFVCMLFSTNLAHKRTTVGMMISHMLVQVVCKRKF